VKKLLIAGIETESGRHLVRQLARQTDVLGVPFSTRTLIPSCGIRRLPRTTPESVRLLLEADAITHVVFCGRASCSGWSSAPLETRPCSDSSELQAFSAACAEMDIPFVFISSDIPFEGPWVFHKEDSECVAETPLARSIRHQEAIVAERENALIVRTHVCGFAPQSLLARRLLLETASLPVHPRWYATPIYAGRFARLLCGLIDRQATGIYHLGGGERISHSQFVSQLEERFPSATNSAGFVSQTPHEALPAPRESSLRSSKARRLLNEGLPAISDFLNDVAADLESGAACELAEVTVPASVRVA
jgi:dTDP-4-dehydrorhamnose reductase